MLEPTDAQVTVPTDRGNAKIPPADEMMTDGYGDAPSNSRTLGGGVDFFSSLGTERVKKPPPNRPNPDEVRLVQSYPLLHVELIPLQLKVQSKELKKQLKEGKYIEE